MPEPLPNRHQLRQRRRQLAPAERIAAAHAIATHLLAFPAAPQRGYVAGYWAVDGEVPLHVWQLQLPKDCIWCLPVLEPEARVLKFAPWKPGDALCTNRYGIPEPDLAASSLLHARDMALIALPLTGFDARGNRLGMGGGWYDRTLAFRQQSDAPPLTIGIGFDVQEVPALSPSPWDVPCDAIITETRTLQRTST